MISVCWAGANLENLIKAIKFLELASRYMLAITNLAICVNLALIVMAHRTLSRVNNLSSALVIYLSVGLSIGTAAASVPFWDSVILTATYFFPINKSEGAAVWMTISGFFLEFIVGTCMFAIVAWLLLFRTKEVMECWRLHARIRYYFCLTAIGIAVNLALGISGTIYVVDGREKPFLMVIAWTARHVHIALDTIVLYGVLGAPARQMDERGGSPPSSDRIVSGTGSRNSSNPASSNGGFRSISGLTKRDSKPRVPNTRRVQGHPKEASTPSRRLYQID
ncbi:unnamed protein product [Ectocarpus fasciculatus]